MDPARWQQIERLYHEALARPSAERAAFLAEACAGDETVRGEVEALLDAPPTADGVFAAPALQVAVQMVGDPASSVLTGRRLGVYHLHERIGVGGMGEVYRARDTKLGRDVAIKILPRAFTDDPDRLARFQREARVLATLNHPNIATIHGVEDGHGVHALVMELVDGSTLADRIRRGPVRLPESLSIARQIADALQAAHEKGIVHRDLKPANIKITPAGTAKVLDFGLAKVAVGDDAASEAPTATVGGTHDGIILGTPAYMSPEQVRGLPVDKRTDIWAFGCLLYELLTGRQAFAGNTASDSLAAVLERHPDMAILPAGTPTGVRSLLRHCLEKDSKRRLRDIADARLAIDDALNPPPDERSGPDTRDAHSRRAAVRMRMVWLFAGLAIAASAGIVVRELPTGASLADQPRRTITSIVLPRGMRLAGSDLQVQASESRFAVSPDGRQLALIASDETGRARLWLRDLGSAAFQPLPQTEDASFPFWSPDSESIGFVAAGRLKAIRLSDGTAMTVNETGFRIGAWSRNNRILFAPAPSSPLYVVSASGGASTPVTRLDNASGEVQHSYPAFLPDGRHFLYFSIGSLSGGVLDPRGIYLGSLDTAEPAKLLIPGATQARYGSGHILFVRSGTLMAQPFETESGELRGTPLPLVEDVKLSTAGATGATAAFSVSDNGVLAYQAAARTESHPVVFDRNGRQLAALAAPADYGEVALSPDGMRLAVSVTDPARSTRDLWLYDADSGRGQRVTFEPGDEFAPVWSPDGGRLLFSSVTNGLVNLHVKDVMTTSNPVPVEVDNLGLGRFAADWSRDGRNIMYIGGGRAISRSDIWVAPVATTREARALLDSPFVETHGRFAPHGRWFGYASNETGQLEVYVDRFPDRGAKRLVSTKGGHWPRWARDGTELFYVSPENQLMAVAMKATRDRLDVGVPRPLFAIRPRPPVRLDAYPYDVSSDGRRFVVNTLMDDTTSTTITVVLNWTAGLP